jgi:mitofilin
VPTSAINQSKTVEPPVVEPGNIPKPPPSPEEVGAAASKVPPAGIDTSSAPTAPPVQPKKKGRFRRYLLYFVLLSALGYGGGVYASLINDNWHDFFPEYVPFGEDAVAYFEEREFKKRFPRSAPARLHQQVRGEPKVKIGSRSGVSASLAQEEKLSDLGVSGRHMSAVEDNHPRKPAPTKEEPIQTPNIPVPRGAVETKQAPAAAAKPKAEKETPKEPAPQPEQIETTPPPPPAPISAIDNVNIELGTEPVVQDVVKILNNIITVINADNAQDKYGSTISTAKDNLTKVISDISSLKATEQKAAEDKINALHTEFDTMAKELIRRQEEAIQNQELRWKEEYEAEQAKLREAYEGKLKAEIEDAQKVYDQKLKNELLEQAIALRKEFTQQVRDQVEGEREGRLSKLSQLSDSVQDLEKLTGEWNSVVDANLKTQHLLVAVEAVRMKLENADKPRPFIEELVALKEVASDDPVVNAAIASINPTAYQRGIPTPSQLIDRFRRVAHEVRKASLLPENAGVASHVASLVLSKLMFKKSGLPVGDDVESVLSRTEVLLEEGNLDQAAREMNSLTGWAKTLSRDWLGDVRKVLEVQQALDVSFSSFFRKM